MKAPNISALLSRFPFGLLCAVVLLLPFEILIARGKAIWDFNENSSTGTIAALERHVVKSSPTPHVVLLGSSRMRDAIAPRQLEKELGCRKKTALNLAVSAGGIFEAATIYDRNRRKLRHAEVVVLNVDSWNLDATELPTMNVRRYASWRSRLGIYDFDSTVSLMFGWAFRSYDLRPRLRGLVDVWLEDKPQHKLHFLPDGRTAFRHNGAEISTARGSDKREIEGLEKLEFSPGRQAELARLVARIRKDGPKVLLVEFPVRDDYAQKSLAKYGAKLDEFEDRLRSIEGADVETYWKGSDVGVAPTGFYDYGHMDRSGSRVMTKVIADVLRERYSTCAKGR